MKNKIKYILLPAMLIIAIIFIATNYGQRLRFGDAWFENDTANKILTNKSLYFESGDSIYYNNVVVTSGTGGGGIAASDNITFTGRDSTTELWRFGDSVRFYDHVLFKDTLKVSGAIAIMDSLKIAKNLWFNNTTKLSTTLGTFYSMENAFLWQNQNAYSLLDLDSSNGMNLHYGVYTGNGSQLTNVDAITLKGQDTTHFARTDTLTTEGIKGIWGFWNTVRFYTTTTFDVSPVFSALVNFANGITVTGTATFNGDMVNTGWKSQGAMLNTNKYYRDTVLYMVTVETVPYVATNYSVTHGIANWKSIVSWDILIHDDSLNMIIRPNLYPTTAYTTSYLFNYATVDSLTAKIHIPAASVSLFNDTCTVLIRYTDYNR